MRIKRAKKRSWLPTSGPRMSNRLIVRHSGSSYHYICDYFVRKHGFSDLWRLHRDKSLRSKVVRLKDLILDSFYVLRNLRFVRNAREIIAIGSMAYSIALLLKLDLLPSCRHVYWFGLFIHNPRWLRFARCIFRVLDSKKIQYVIFSNFEKALYAKSLLLNEDKMFHIPYGDLSEQKITPGDEISQENVLGEGEFFFSGGYSSRDYPSLIKTFRTLPYKLIIVCSMLNTEVDESLVPPNIKVLRELSSESFDAYIRASKACILPIAHDTGAAGQSCLLRYMKNRKIIIATNTGIIREYITDGISGILVKDNLKAMAMAVKSVATSIESYRNYSDAAYERFVKTFSGEATRRRLCEMINQNK